MQQLAVPAESLRLKLGTVSAAPDASVEFSDRDIATHMAVYGGTGKGQSKLVELLVRQLIYSHAGACIIDPHGDLVEDLMLHIMDHYEPNHSQIFRRIHYFEPGSNEYRF